MPKSPRQWSFLKLSRRMRKAVADHELLRSRHDDFVMWYHDKADRGALTAVTLSSLPQSSIANVWMWQAIALAGTDPHLAFRYLHLCVRCLAFYHAVMLLRNEELRTEWLADPTRPKPAVAQLDSHRLADVTMTAAACMVLRLKPAGRSLFERCLKLCRLGEPYTTQDVLTGGHTGLFLLRLYARSVNAEWPAEWDAIPLRPFQPVFDRWDDPAFADVLTDLAELHARKALDPTRLDEDGVYGFLGWYSCFPAELLYLKQVREQFGLPVDHAHHEMLDSPLTRIPTDDIASGYDEYLDFTTRVIRASDMPHLRLEWEEQLQAVGPGDPRSLKLPFPVTMPVHSSSS